MFLFKVVSYFTTLKKDPSGGLANEPCQWTLFLLYVDNADSPIASKLKNPQHWW